MILAYDSIGDCLRFELFAVDGVSLYKKTIAPDPAQKVPRFDLLLQLTEFMEQSGVAPTDIEKIIFVCGPGRFTAVRTACIVANAFGAHADIGLIPITKTELTAANDDFATFTQHQPLAKGVRAESLFDAPPSIHGNKIAASDTLPL